MKLWLADTEEAVDVADGSDQRTKLSHLTSDRPRAPSRRPPSNYQPTTSTTASVDTVSDWPLSVCLSVSGWLTTLLQCFDTVGWVIRPIKTVGRITYVVLVQTLNHAQSINQCLSVTVSACSTRTSSESFIHLHSTHNGVSLHAEFLADRTNSRAYATVLHLSVDCCRRLYGMYSG